ncbi:hypothetical protein EDB85DRAFT_2144869 [Lactarius pseudohatsudake]|nr:hypothetical protein EDB85DRAFT_2144869 [Lactarius pseudohatsudake]
MVEQFFECKDYRESFKDYDTRQAWAKDMLEDCKFVWEKVDKRSSLMRAPFILQVFATHLNSTAGAEEVPALRATGVNEGASIVAKYLPKGALALAAAARSEVSYRYRTLKLWADGEMEVLHAADPVKKQASKPSIKVASKLNPLTGIVSNVASKFSAENWAGQAKLEPGSGPEWLVASALDLGDTGDAECFPLLVHLVSNSTPPVSPSQSLRVWLSWSESVLTLYTPVLSGSLTTRTCSNLVCIGNNIVPGIVDIDGLVCDPLNFYFTFPHFHYTHSLIPIPRLLPPVHHLLPHHLGVVICIIIVVSAGEQLYIPFIFPIINNDNFLSFRRTGPSFTPLNTTLYARYVEEQTSAMWEMLRCLSEDVDRLKGIGRAQAQLYERSINDFERHHQEMDIEQRALISQVNYLAEEVILEKRLGIAQLCLLLTVLAFLSVTRSSPGEFHVPPRRADAMHKWGQRNLALSGDWVSHLRSGPPVHLNGENIPTPHAAADDYDRYFFRFVYDKMDASFSEPLPTPLHADPPYNCTICARREEEEIEAHARVVRCAGGVAGVAVHSTMFHVVPQVALSFEVLGSDDGDDVGGDVGVDGMEIDLTSSGIDFDSV